MPRHYQFFVPVRVRYVETDMQGHVFFGHYLTYFDLAATEYIKAIGYGMADFLREGVDFFYVESHCEHKGRAYFDQVLHVHAAVTHLGRTSFRFEFAIFAEDSDQLIATGHIVAVVVDGKQSRPSPIPDGFRTAVAAYEENPASAPARVALL